jgi:hypothetical protein
LNVVQRQLAAYNAKDMEGLLATYAVDAEQYTLQNAWLKDMKKCAPGFSQDLLSPT